MASSKVEEDLCIFDADSEVVLHNAAKWLRVSLFLYALIPQLLQKKEP